METTFICLIGAAVVLLIFIIAQQRLRKKGDPKTKESPAVLPDIIGRPKDPLRLPLPTTALQGNLKGSPVPECNFDTGNEGNIPISEIPQEEPEEILNALPDWEEEEQEMVKYAAHSTEEGFAMGVTFDELAAVGKMLEREALEPSEKETAAGIISKIDWTELLGLLESRIGEASKRIAMLLDAKLGRPSDSGSSFLRNDSDYDIGDYV